MILAEGGMLTMAMQSGVTGRRIPRLDAVAKVTGQAKYTADINVPDANRYAGKPVWNKLLFGKILRCPLPTCPRPTH
jgi:CO/xanthine dehydrogenase Mo-binding subunit